MLALAARQLGIAAIPVMVAAGWSEAQKRAYVLADNQLAIRTAVVRDPYARWCGRGGTARCPPIPIFDPDRPLALSDNNGRSWATKQKSIKPHQLQASALDSERRSWPRP